MSATILYFDADTGGGRIREASLAGVRRYAGSLRWDVLVVPPEESRPEGIPGLLSSHRPVAGCVVDGSDGRRDLPPRLFGSVPVVYMHADPSLYGRRGVRVGYDDEAIAEAAFRELSAGLPEAFAVVPFDYPTGRRGWSLRRERAFAALAASSGKPFFRFPWRREPAEARGARLARWLSALPRHTAIFAVGDMAAVETAAAARRCHRAIPRELTLVGVGDNASLSTESRPTLSSIRIDHELAGYLAAKAISEIISSANNADLRASAALREKTQCHSEILVKPLLAVRRESTGGYGRREPFVLEAMETIRREACEGLTVATLVKRFGCSRPLFDLRFREAVGHSAQKEILHVRLEKAFTLLSRTDTPIGAIAGFCGFASNIALHRLFRRRTGMSMGEWRKRNWHP